MKFDQKALLQYFNSLINVKPKKTFKVFVKTELLKILINWIKVR